MTRITANSSLPHGTVYRLIGEAAHDEPALSCGLGAAWLRQREVAIGFWTAGLVVLLALFRAHYGDALNIAL